MINRVNTLNGYYIWIVITYYPYGHYIITNLTYNTLFTIYLEQDWSDTIRLHFLYFNSN